jgi:hypothetical protein
MGNNCPYFRNIYFLCATFKKEDASIVERTVKNKNLKFPNPEFNCL